MRRASLMITCFLGLCAVAGPASGQFTMFPPAPDSPYWWTLSDELEPKELRQQLQSRAASRERLQADVEAGLHEPVAAERLADLSIYVNGHVTPALVPMWDAFDRYTFRFRRLPGLSDDYPSQAREELQAAGMSAEGAEDTIVVAEEHLRLEQAVIDESRDLARRFAYEVVAPARERIGERAADRVVRQGDFTWLSRLSGRSEQTVREWHAAWRRDPQAEAGVVSVETLRERLDDSDWRALRGFLLREVASRMGDEDYGEWGYRLGGLPGVRCPY